jgi:hypothetical protein
MARYLLYLLATLLLAVTLSGCYGEINITSQFPESGLYNNDSSEVFFYHFDQVARSAKGIAAFPDGGTPKILFKNLSLHQYYVKSRTIETVFDFGQLPYYHSRWKYLIFLNHNSLIFKISPNLGWQKEMEWGLDSSLFSKYKNWFVFNIESGEISTIDSFKQEGFNNFEISFTQLKNQTDNLNYLDWGVDIDKICPISKNKKIKTLVKLQGNQKYRNAIIESLDHKINDKDVDKIINDINNNLDGLSSYEKLRKETFAAETISKLQKLIK